MQGSGIACIDVNDVNGRGLPEGFHGFSTPTGQRDGLLGASLARNSMAGWVGSDNLKRANLNRVLATLLRRPGFGLSKIVPIDRSCSHFVSTCWKVMHDSRKRHKLYRSGHVVGFRSENRIPGFDGP